MPKSKKKKHSKKKHSERTHSKKKHSGVKKDRKNHKCHVNYEPCKKVPEPLVVENMECLKKFWEEGKYKCIAKFLPGISSKYPNGFLEKGIYNISHKDKYRIHNSFIGNRYVEKENKIPMNRYVNFMRNHEGHIIGHDTSSLGTNSNSYLTKCTPTKIEEFHETNSEAFGQNI